MRKTIITSGKEVTYIGEAILPANTHAHNLIMGRQKAQTMSLYEVMKRDYLHNVNTGKVLVVESGGKFYCIDDLIVEEGELKSKCSNIAPAYEKTFRRAFVEVEEPRPLAELVAEWSAKNE